MNRFQSHNDYDGLYEQARRGYTPSQRSWHIPEEPKTVPWHFILGVPAMVVGLCLICAVGG